MTAKQICSRIASLALVCGFYVGPAAGQTITEIIDATGDGAGSFLSAPHSVAVANDGTVYLASGVDLSGPDYLNRIFRIEIDGVVTLFFDGSDGTCLGPAGIAVDNAENVHVACRDSKNAIKIEPGGTVTEIIDSTAPLDGPRDIAVDSVGNVYLADAGLVPPRPTSSGRGPEEV